MPFLFIDLRFYETVGSKEMADEEKSEALKEGETTELKEGEQPEAQKEEEAPEPKDIVTIEEAGPCKKKVTIEIVHEKIKKAIDKQYEEMGKEALVPGFRKGRAPRRLLEKRKSGYFTR